MEFSGRVYFDVISGDSWRFYQLIARAFEERVQIRLEWRSWVAGGLGDGPLTGQLRALAAYEWVREAVPTKQGPFLQALFIAVHEERAPPGDAATIALAARLAGLDAEIRHEAAGELAAAKHAIDDVVAEADVVVSDRFVRQKAVETDNAVDSRWLNIQLLGKQVAYSFWHMPELLLDVNQDLQKTGRFSRPLGKRRLDHVRGERLGHLLMLGL